MTIAASNERIERLHHSGTPHTRPTVLKRLELPRLPSSSSRVLISGALLTTIILLIAVFAPQLAPYDMAKMNPIDRLQAPSWTHPFGTDLFGRDLFSRVIIGSRYSLTVAFAAVLVGSVPGMLAGIVAGMQMGKIEQLVTLCMDAWLALPALLLVLVLAASLGRSTGTLIIALALAGIPMYYRLARGETLRIVSEPYLDSARALGANERQLLFYHVLPNVLPSLIVLIALRVGRMLLAVSALSFIGLGAPPPNPEWGALLAEGREYMQHAWWLTFFPGCAIAISVFSFNLFSDGLRDLLDPRLRH